MNLQMIITILGILCLGCSIIIFLMEFRISQLRKAMNMVLKAYKNLYLSTYFKQPRDTKGRFIKRVR